MVKLIDCTLRDGGYHNFWNFSQKFAEETIRTLFSAGVNDIEIGFRKPKSKEKPKEGIFANLDLERLNAIKIPEGTNIGIMLNAADYMNESRIDMKLIEESFSNKEHNLKFIRIAADKEDIPKLVEVKNYLESLGYEFHLNLMRINTLFNDDSFSRVGESTLEEIFKLEIENLTLADTYGIIRGNELTQLITKVKEIGEINLGLHMHNNLGLATSNSMLGLEAGISMLDSTLTGMGRGPGNLRTEFIVDEIAYLDKSVKYNSKSLLGYAARVFEPLKDQFKWGESSFYNLGAKNLVHPSYVQYLTQNGDYSASEILEAIDFLGTRSQIQFSEEYLSFVLQDQLNRNVELFSTQMKKFDGVRSAIILGAGDSIASMPSMQFKSLKSDEKEITVSLTLRPKFDRMLIDTYLIIDPVKYFIDYKILESHNSMVVTPFNLRHQNAVRSSNIVFPTHTQKAALDLVQHQATLPHLSSLGYALMFMVEAKIFNIKLAGFDGFEKDDPRQSQNQEIIDLFQSKYSHEYKLEFITPTSYRIIQ
jgi:4-hydroxy 2-oxovalerate aldolase